MTSVLHQTAAIRSTVMPVQTGSYTYHLWVKMNSASYSASGDHSIFGAGFDTASSQGILIGCFGGATTFLDFLLFTGGGGTTTQDHILTGSDVGWVACAIRHVGGTANYDLSYRRENQTSWTTITRTVGVELTLGGSLNIGGDQFPGEEITDGDSRHFFCQETYMSDAALLTASQNINSAPAGTNLHWLRLLDSGTALTNGGTSPNWTLITGTLQTAATEPSETPPSPTDIPGGRISSNVRLGNNFKLCA